MSALFELAFLILFAVLVHYLCGSPLKLSSGPLDVTLRDACRAHGEFVFLFCLPPSVHELSFPKAVQDQPPRLALLSLLRL